MKTGQPAGSQGRVYSSQSLIVGPSKTCKTVTDDNRVVVTSPILFGGIDALQSGNRQDASPATRRRARRAGRPPCRPSRSTPAGTGVLDTSAAGRRRPVDRLDSYDSLIAWAREQNLLSAAAASRLSAAARKHPRQAAAVLARAKDFREALNSLAVALDTGRQPGADVLETIGECLAGAYANGRLVPMTAPCNGWPAQRTTSSGCYGNWPGRRAAGRLPRLTRVRACAASDCGWWFVDDTKNRSRRWRCDMKLCGNREKLRRFRSKNSEAEPRFQGGSRGFQ